MEREVESIEAAREWSGESPDTGDTVGIDFRGCVVRGLASKC